MFKKVKECLPGDDVVMDLKNVKKELTTIRSITTNDVSPALVNVQEGLLSLTVLCHRWIMSYDKKVSLPNENDPFLLLRPGSRMSLLQSFRVSFVVCDN